MNRLGIDVINVGEDDIAELMDLGIDLAKDDHLISANLISTKTGQPLLKPFVVKLIPLKDKDTDKKFRVGFLGLSACESSLPTDSRGYTWADPSVSAGKWLAGLREKCDFLIVLACMPSKDAVQLAVDNSNINIIINGYKHQFSSPPATINKSTLMYAEDEGRVLGELRFLIGPGRQLDVNPISHFLTATVKDDPEMAVFLAKARTEISATQLQLAKLDATPSIPAKSDPVSEFVTASNCGSCHPSQYDTWSKSAHSHAMEILRKEHKEFDTGCVGCHVTGFKKSGGFIDLYETSRLANVQCEVCHGPGRGHGLNPKTVKMLKAGPETCQGCHTNSRSPEFDFTTYWEKIKH